MENNELNTNTGATEVEPTEKETYSKEEVMELLQKETDRRVTSALKKQAEKQAQKLKEAERLSQMSAEQKYEYELSQREAAIVEKERQLTLAENKNAASKVLADKGLDLSLIDLVVADEAEVMNERINLLDKAFKKSVKAEVEKRLASKSPVSTLDQNKTYSKSDFARMTLAQLAELKKTQPELFEN